MFTNMMFPEMGDEEDDAEDDHKEVDLVQQFGKPLMQADEKITQDIFESLMQPQLDDFDDYGGGGDCSPKTNNNEFSEKDLMGYWSGGRGQNTPVVDDDELETEQKL